MATTINLVANSVTPCSAKYVVATDLNPPASGLRSLTQLLADLHEGPLKAALRSIGAGSLATFNVDQAAGEAIRIYDSVSMPGDASASRNGSSDIHWVSNADPAVAGLYASLEALDTRIIEIRINHTTQA